MSNSEACEKLLTRTELADGLSALGYKITAEYLSQLAHRGLGPPVELFWGGRRRPLHKLSRGIAWAKSRCTPAEPVAA
jgi:hypothetical protein